MIKLAEIFSNLIINLVYFSRKDATYHSKKRTYSNKIVGYGISLIAFIATLYSFVSDKFDSKTKLFFFVVFWFSFSVGLFLQDFTRRLISNRKVKQFFYGFCM